MQIYEKHPGLPSHLKMLFLLLVFLETGIRLAVTTRLSCAMTKRAINKGAGTSEASGQTKEKLWVNDTSRNTKVLKSGPNHGCQ